MKSRFEPDFDQSNDADLNSAGESSVCKDPDSFDDSEQQFAASLEAPASHFVVEEAGYSQGSDIAPEVAASCDTSEEPRDAPSPTQADLLEVAEDDSWRREVAARLNQYRSRRRPKAPRYPSLRLKFEEPAWNSHARSEGSLAPAVPPDGFPPKTETPSPSIPAETGKLLEFPRPAHEIPRQVDELAEPVLERPRILEAPEVAPPPPALGGIHIEAQEPDVEPRRPGIDLPLQAAPTWRRWLASGVDVLIVDFSLGAFGAIFLKITAAQLTWQQAASVSLGLLLLFWAAYQYSMLVLTGTTPGLRIAGLQLSRFDGREVPRHLRRWRVLAILLSGLSLGLGYLWAFLDEDALCWHDRITRTYAAPKSTMPSRVSPELG
jgi:uncharacterized RDD family membrane protein YckC